MSEHQPLVSVLMATYNEKPDIVKTAVNSILSQTYKNIELLIMDDSKSAETIECLDELAADPRIKLIRKDYRMGLSGARNVGLAAAVGSYIAIMDGDDFSLPDRIKLQTDYLESHKNVSVLGGQMNIMTNDGEVVSSRKYPCKGFKLWLFSAFRNPIAHPAVMFRAELFKKGFIYNENYEMSEDLDLWLRIMMAGYKVENLPDTLINYRIAANFTEKRTGKKQTDYMFMVRRKNFSWRHPLFSLLSFIAGFIFSKAPAKALKKMYHSENKQ